MARVKEIPSEKETEMRVIGIDIGTIHCGYGIIEVQGFNSSRVHQRFKEAKKFNNHSTFKPFNHLTYIASGMIEMNKKDALPLRLKLLYSSLKKIIDEYRPSHLCIEKIFYHKSIRSAFTLGGAWGIAMLLAGEFAIPVFEYNPTELKRALTGYGRAEKSQVKEMVIRILGSGRTMNPKLSLDAADALALCICHINSSNWMQDT